MADSFNSFAGVMGDQIDRLLRTKWKSPQSLAQELYAMFSAINETVGKSTPLTFDAPANSKQPALVFRGFGPQQPIMAIQRPDGSTITMTPSGFTDNGVPFPDLGFAPSGVAGVNGVPVPPVSTGKKPPKPSGAAGTVQSGSGDTYQVQLVGKQPKTVTAKQGQIATAETIPAGTFVILAVVDEQYYMQVPVWMDDLT